MIKLKIIQWFPVSFALLGAYGLFQAPGMVPIAITLTLASIGAAMGASALLQIPSSKLLQRGGLTYFGQRMLAIALITVALGLLYAAALALI